MAFPIHEQQPMLGLKLYDKNGILFIIKKKG